VLAYKLQSLSWALLFAGTFLSRNPLYADKKEKNSQTLVCSVSSGSAVNSPCAVNFFLLLLLLRSLFVSLMS